MEQENYVILRQPEEIDLGDVFSGGLEGISIEPDAGLRVEAMPLSNRDLGMLRRDPRVVGVAPEIPVRLIAPLEVEEDEADHSQATTWGVAATRAAESPFSGSGAVVAVLDTGINAGHAAFNGVNIVEQDFTGEGNGDGHGHGTHVAGTVFGQDVGGLRIGVAPGIDRALIGKVLDSEGGGTTQMIYEGILWAAEQGAHLISMSLGFDFPGYSQWLVGQGLPVDLATDRALRAYVANVRLFDKLAALMIARSRLFQSTLLIAAAGNESKRYINPAFEVFVAPPAAAEGFISVGALQTAGPPHDNLQVAYFSNTGPNVSGPGVAVVSANAGGGLVAFSGTSMATPHVAGVAALWIEKLQQATGRPVDNIELASRLLGQATRSALAPDIDHVDVGAGLVQAPLA